jgi:hypothetical protein
MKNFTYVCLAIRIPPPQRWVTRGGGIPAPQERTSGRSRPAGAWRLFPAGGNFPRFTLLL